MATFTVPLRYYAGDQESLFREAHLVYPSRQRKVTNSKPTGLRVTTTHTHTHYANFYVTKMALNMYFQKEKHVGVHVHVHAHAHDTSTVVEENMYNNFCLMFELK